MRQLGDIAELSARALSSLRTIVDRRASSHAADDIVDESAVPADLDRYLPGNHYGAHREMIVKREVRYATTPEWFDPRTIPGQFGLVTDAGLRVYMEVEVDVAARSLPSTFMRKILTLAEEVPVQIALL